MNEAYIFFAVIYGVVIMAILALFARDLVKWLKSRRTKRAADLAGFARCKKCGRVSIGHPFKGCANFTPSR